MHTSAPAAPASPETRVTNLLNLPRIGQHWPEHGGLFAGLVAGVDGAPDRILILGPEFDDELPWNDAVTRAAHLRTHDFDDWRLPTRSEQAVLYGNLKHEFKDDWYWSGEQDAGAAGYAWCQGFSNGGQYDNHKSFQLRARAVRSIAI